MGGVSAWRNAGGNGLATTERLMAGKEADNLGAKP